MKLTVAAPAAAGWSEQGEQLPQLWRVGSPSFASKRSWSTRQQILICRSELARETLGDTGG